MRYFSCTLVFCLFAAGAFGQPIPANPPPSIRTTGEATVIAKPDQAHIGIGVVTQAATAEGAATQNAAQTTAVIASVRQAGAAAAGIKTSGYSLEPNYVYPPQGGKPQIQGYTARNTIEVTTSDLAGVGKLIDAATQAGANNIQRLEFTLRDDQPARTEALRDAVAKAKVKAHAIASALGVKIVRVLSVEEGSTPALRPLALAASRVEGNSAPTPVEPGTLEIHANVTLHVEISE